MTMLFSSSWFTCKVVKTPAMGAFIEPFYPYVSLFTQSLPRSGRALVSYFPACLLLPS